MESTNSVSSVSIHACLFDICSRTDLIDLTVVVSHENKNVIDGV